MLQTARVARDAKGFTDIEVSVPGGSFKMKKNPRLTPLGTPHSNTHNNEDLDNSEHFTPVKTPLTGVLYFRPGPDLPPFVAKGEVIKAGQTVAHLETMKIFNEVLAEQDGTVETDTENNELNGKLVHQGDTIMMINTNNTAIEEEVLTPYH